VIELSNQLNFFLFFNSLGIIFLILYQNESSRDSISSISRNSPLENFTWFSVILEFSLFLIKIKNSDFN